MGAARSLISIFLLTLLSVADLTLASQREFLAKSRTSHELDERYSERPRKNPRGDDSPLEHISFFAIRPENFVLGEDVLPGDDDGNSTHDEQKRGVVPITFHGGSVLRGTVNVYIVWYGDWTSTASNLRVHSILENFLSSVGGTPWFSINQDYSDAYGSVSGAVRLSGTSGFGTRTYTHGSSLTVAQVFSVAQDAIQQSLLPFDDNGIYFVLTSADVQQTSGATAYCTGYCGWHTVGSMTYGGATKSIKYAFVGHPGNCGSCDSQKISPNGDWAGDAMASIVGHELSESSTDPLFNAWYDANGEENADKCAWTYGTLYTDSNGAKYNMQFGGMNWLIQRNWMVSGNCATAGTAIPAQPISPLRSTSPRPQFTTAASAAPQVSTSAWTVLLCILIAYAQTAFVAAP